MIRTARAVHLAVVITIVLGACTGDEPTASDNKPECTWVIGTMGELSGAGSDESVRAYRAIELAIETATVRGTTACEIELASEDTTGDADRAGARARALVGNDRLIACVCPYRSVEALVGGTVFGSHGVLMASTGTSNEIANQSFDTWFRVLPNESVQIEATGEYIRGVLEPKAVAVIDDGSNQGVALADGVATNLGVLASERASLSTTDAGSFAEKLSDKPPEVVYYAGAGGAAGQIATALRDSDVDSLVLVAGAEPDSVPTAVDLGSVSDLLVICPCVDPSSIREGSDLVDAYTQAYDELPGMFGTEVFDITAIVVEALEGVPGEAPIEEVRKRVVRHFEATDGSRGISGRFSWDESGEREVDALDSVWVYEWNPGRATLEPIGPVSALL